MDNVNPDKGRAFFEKLKLNDTLVKDFVQKTNDEFDFTCIIKRLDESLVLLSFMLYLPISDVLCTDAKMSGQYTIPHRGKECRCIPSGSKCPLFLSTVQFLQSDR